MANSTYTDEFYRVSFITTSSVNIPRLLKQTGGLIVMNHIDGKPCPVNNEHGVHFPKSLWFRGNMIATGYGALCEEERDNLTYLAGTYNSLFEGIDDRFENTSYIINTYHNEFLAAYSYTIDTIDRVKAESYSYTNQQIDHLIGCAPETLDTLGEIAHWLEHDAELGMDSVRHIREIGSSYITHDEIDEGGYVYLSPKGWQITYSVKQDIHNDPPNPSRPNEECSGGNVFSYEIYTAEPYGTVALRDHQVSTHYAYAQLSEVLDCLIHPYPYTEPCVYVSSYNITTNDTRYSYSYAEIGETISFEIDYRYFVNDSEAITQIQSFTSNGNVKVGTAPGVNYPEDSDGIHKITGTFKVTEQENQLQNSFSYSFKASPIQYYPQLKELQIEDDKHTFEANTRIVNDILNIRARWKAFSKSGTGVIPTKDSDLTNDDYYWLQNIPDETIILDNIDVSESDIWFALPDFYDPTVFNVYLENVYTGIKQEVKPSSVIKGIGNTNVNLHGLNDSDILNFKPVNLFKYKNTNRNYIVYVIENHKFNMANQYNLRIEHLWPI